jgi:hypothetical protein
VRGSAGSNVRATEPVTATRACDSPPRVEDRAEVLKDGAGVGAAEPGQMHQLVHLVVAGHVLARTGSRRVSGGIARGRASRSAVVGLLLGEPSAVATEPHAPCGVALALLGGGGRRAAPFGLEVRWEAQTN